MKFITRAIIEIEADNVEHASRMSGSILVYNALEHGGNELNVSCFKPAQDLRDNKELVAGIRKEFIGFRNGRTSIWDHNTDFDLRTGDVIIFRDGSGNEQVSEILGFDAPEVGDAYILRENYWEAIVLWDSFIQKIG